MLCFFLYRRTFSWTAAIFNCNNKLIAWKCFSTKQKIHQNLNIEYENIFNWLKSNIKKWKTNIRRRNKLDIIFKLQTIKTLDCFVTFVFHIHLNELLVPSLIFSRKFSSFLWINTCNFCFWGRGKSKSILNFIWLHAENCTRCTNKILTTLFLFPSLSIQN